MSDRKSYSAARFRQDEVPTVFDLEAPRSDDQDDPGRVESEEFKAWPSRIPATFVLDFGIVEVKEGSNIVRDLFRKVLEAGDFDRFDSFLHTHDVPAGLIGQIMRDLQEAGAGRPTQQ